MKKTMIIEGMMCEHCERAIKTALEALPFIENAEASHEAGTARITLSGPLDASAIQKAVEDEDYEFISVEQILDESLRG